MCAAAQISWLNCAQSGQGIVPSGENHSPEHGRTLLVRAPLQRYTSGMPIRLSLRWLYPIDWPQLSRWVRFTRAKGCCETCGRPHGVLIACLPDGRWRDTRIWRDGKGRRTALPASLDGLRYTHVILATAHRDHDPTHNHPGNLAALCQRCHIIHDRPYHLAQRRLSYLRRWALGDLFLGPYPPAS